MNKQIINARFVSGLCLCADTLIDPTISHAVQTKLKNHYTNTFLSENRQFDPRAHAPIMSCTSRNALRFSTPWDNRSVYKVFVNESLSTSKFVRNTCNVPYMCRVNAPFCFKSLVVKWRKYHYQQRSPIPPEKWPFYMCTTTRWQCTTRVLSNTTYNTHVSLNLASRSYHRKRMANIRVWYRNNVRLFVSSAHQK